RHTISTRDWSSDVCSSDLVVRYSETLAPSWILTAGATMGVTVLAKETSIVLLGGLYAFFALTPVVRMRLAHLVLSALAMVAVARSEERRVGKEWRLLRAAT